MVRILEVTPQLWHRRAKLPTGQTSPGDKPPPRRWYRQPWLIAALTALLLAGTAITYGTINSNAVAVWLKQSTTLALRHLTGTTPPSTEVPQMRLGIVWGGPEQGLMVEGARLAADKINEAGGILGHNLVLEVINDGGPQAPPASATEIAHHLVGQANMFAAVGHSPTKGAVISSITYEEAGVLFINPFVTAQAVAKHGFTHVFSTIPNDEAIGKQIATFVEGFGLQRIGLLNSRDDWAFTTVDGFIQQAVTLGLEISDRRSFFPAREEFLDLIAEFAVNEFDAIFIVADDKTTSKIIQQCIDLNIETTFIVGRLLNPELLADLIGEVDQQIVVPSLFNPTSTRPEITEFREKFETTFGKMPDSWAAQGFDAVDMLAAASTDAGTLNPLSIASIMRYTLSWQGLTGRHSFDQLGQIYTKQLDFVTIRQGELNYSSLVN